MEYGTIKIPKPAYDHHNERRQELNQTWEQYINGQAPDVPNSGEVTATVDTEGLVNDLVAELPPRIADELR